MRANLAKMRENVSRVIHRERSKHHTRFIAVVFGIEVVTIVSIHEVLIHLGVAGTIAAAEFFVAE